MLHRVCRAEGSRMRWRLCRNTHDLSRLNLLFLVATCSMFPAAKVHAQTAEPRWEQQAGGVQQFEVASVRENKSSDLSTSNFPLDSGNAFVAIDKNYRSNPQGSLLSARNWPLLTYIAFAYKLTGTQYLALRFDFYSGLGLQVPQLVRNDRYDLEARAPGSATKDQMRLMMQSLLAERFKLSAHWETRDVPVFALVQRKRGLLGPQLKPHG